MKIRNILTENDFCISVLADVRYPLIVLVGLDLQSSPTE